MPQGSGCKGPDVSFVKRHQGTKSTEYKTEKESQRQGSPKTRVGAPCSVDNGPVSVIKATTVRAEPTTRNVIRL
ncbi:hypothetical protein X797_006721 [Metarhizium robertsii]|uniref:Uncharacterized protein n=1 Tax=Metarhizium robertsii TaxID=568076 RepID=A0A0A1UU52_9HYPO|nr:hypothetical protein X797_006721 [Metarhizium robertsii]